MYVPQRGFLISTLIVTCGEHRIKIYIHNKIISQREKIILSHNQITNNQAINCCN
jgi:hypothetical protein